MIDFTIPSTATALPGMEIGLFDLGEGELDGCDALWHAGSLQFAFDPSGRLMGTSTVGVTPSDPSTIPTLHFFNFHTGCDAQPEYRLVLQGLDNGSILCGVISAVS
jgi:hypothetical protein